MKQQLQKIVLLPLFFLLGVSVVGAAIAPSAVYAQEASQCGQNGVKTSFDFGCPADTNPKSGELEKNPIYIVLTYIINVLAVGVGVAIVGGIVWQSIQYASANGQPDKAKNARTGIINAVLALILFISMYAILNFIIPGGIIG